MPLLSVGLDVFLIALLLVALLMFWRLDQKLQALREGNDGMRQSASELVQAISRAELAIRGLRHASEETGRELQNKIDEARSLMRSADRLPTRPRL